MPLKTKIGVIVVLLLCIGLYAWMNSLPPDSGKSAPKPMRLSNNIGLISRNWDTLIGMSVGGPYGNPAAPWTVIEFGDFQCPQCGKAHEYVRRMVDDGGGKVKAYFCNFPLPKEHPFAESAARAGIAAAYQGKFWPMYEAMYNDQDNLNDAGIRSLASSIKGMNMVRFAADWKSPATSALLAQQMALGVTVKIEVTPSFFARKSNGGAVGRFVGNYGQQADPYYPGLRDLLLKNPWGVHYDPDTDLPDPTREQ